MISMEIVMKMEISSLFMVLWFYDGDFGRFLFRDTLPV
jgi:hypothetical protein